jgi:hypothetical protein
MLRNERQDHRQKDHRFRAGVQHREIDETEHAGHRRADHVHVLAADTIGQMTEQRNRDKRQHRGREHRREQEIAGDVQRPDAVGKDESREDVERRLLGHARQRGEQDFPWMLPDDRQHRGTIHLAFGQ